MQVASSALCSFVVAVLAFIMETSASSPSDHDTLAYINIARALVSLLAFVCLLVALGRMAPCRPPRPFRHLHEVDHHDGGPHRLVPLPQISPRLFLSSAPSSSASSCMPCFSWGCSPREPHPRRRSFCGQPGRGSLCSVAAMGSCMTGKGDELIWFRDVVGVDLVMGSGRSSLSPSSCRAYGGGCKCVTQQRNSRP